MAFLELFERVADHLHRQGVEVMFSRGKPLSRAAIERARSKAKIPIPDSMAEFYAEMGDGLEFQWCAVEGRTPFSYHAFPKLAALAFESLEPIKWRMEWNDSYDYRYTKDPALAKETATRMRKWLAFHDEGNGDAICLDTAADPAPVVFDQHDWFDGGSGSNGHRMGDTLLDFYTKWAQVCFQLPSSLWWPSVFNDSGGVNWNSEKFAERFRLP
jgi:hypothetical protein